MPTTNSPNDGIQNAYENGKDEKKDAPTRNYVDVYFLGKLSARSCEMCV